MNLPLVSVIIPVFNTGKSAKNLVELLLENKYKNIEIIVVDDGSTDDSVGLLENIKDVRVKIFHKKKRWTVKCA